MAGGSAGPRTCLGSGGIALPLTARGVRVDGIELFEAMIAQIVFNSIWTSWLS